MKFYRVMLVSIAGLLVLFPGISMTDTREVSSIGVLAHRGPETAIRMWTPTIDYLSSHGTGCKFRLVPLDLDGMHNDFHQVLQLSLRELAVVCERVKEKPLVLIQTFRLW